MGEIDVSDEKKPTEQLLDHPSYEELQQQLEQAVEKAQEERDRFMRGQAEIENARRRAKLDVESAHKYALEKFVAELLPIVDSLELCIANATDESAEAIIEGVKLTLKMFYTSMEKFGVKQVNPLKQAFVPEFQQAISMQADSSVPPGTVVSVLQKGYILNDRLIRPALVIVAKAEE